MDCVSPPLQKKPPRGYSWACWPCSKAQELKPEARSNPSTIDPTIMDHDREGFEEAFSEGDPGSDSGSGGASSVEAYSDDGTISQVAELSQVEEAWLHAAAESLVNGINDEQPAHTPPVKKNRGVVPPKARPDPALMTKNK
jgi:hypothetical protein